MRRIFKKLEYEPKIIEDITFYVARSKSAKNMRIVVKQDAIPYCVCNIYESELSFEKFIREHIDWVKKSIDKMKKNIPDDTPISNIDKKLLKEKIARFVSIYEIKMGVKVEKWQIRKMKTRWGSCTANKKTIRFSTELCKCNDDFIEYVVVHEMTHFFEQNHQKRFWNRVSKFIPSYKYIKKNKYL